MFVTVLYQSHVWTQVFIGVDVVRGICYFFVEVECASKDLHSGVFGGTV